ncbi:MAG: DEAD/DEAH box helicase [Propionibacteriaceae bacterium]|nr:DEAD/DEAH box helicase [Propionibacteriaceae bacterium]
MAFDEFAARLGFAPDPYQVEACGYLESGSGVLVAAPTGAGKTVVGEFAVYLATLHGSKCFYTTPIKALSNQKFHDLVSAYEADKIGLMTGDQVVNSEADIAVMTTEVLRNMIYAGSPTLRGLEYVVMDEVHYLSDPLRGPVWEEVILGLEPHVKVVGLSATVSNVEEFGAWLASVRGDVKTVVSERRPVPLYQHVFAGRRMYDMYESDAPTAKPTLPDATAPATNPAPTRRAPSGDNRRTPTDNSRNSIPKVNPDLVKMAQQENRVMRDDSRRLRGRSGKGKRGSQGDIGGAAGRFASRSHLVPRRVNVVEELDRLDLLPAIFFIFSRQGCDQAVARLVDDKVWLTSASERDALREIAARQITGLSDGDLDVLKYSAWLEAFERGIAAHHAGLLPMFKVAVEEAFSLGLVKVVFATETLALGINMPARTVVLDKLVKYNGVSHADITAGEYTQLTGRAGRRGIDVEGHAVVTWQAGLDPRALAGLASKRTYPLYSAFTPTYNMTVNLLASMGVERARAILQDSFAQFHSDQVRPKGSKASMGLVRKFESICLVLEALGYVSAERVVTAEGMKLTRLYGSRDLLLAEAIGSNVFDSLSLPSLAATLSTLVYESRLADKRYVPRMPDQASARAVDALRKLAREIHILEKDVRLESAPPLDIGFGRAAYLWASGSDLSEIVANTQLSAGDFVRWVRQTIDCAGQIADATKSTPLAAKCRSLVAAMRRGVVDVELDED